MAVGIIAEYNPFHKGHKYHIDSTIKATGDNIVAIISGNFVQRCEPALLKKHIRAKMALLNGVSMVLELPVEYATGSADVFAFGAVNILNDCSIIDKLSFGSEKGETAIFENIAQILNDEPSLFKNYLKENLSLGMSYPLARNSALESYTGKKLDFMNKPNNILALEYIRQLQKLNSHIKPFTVERIVSDYNSNNLTGEISSASAIRKAILNNDNSALNSMPNNCREFLKEVNSPLIDDFSQILAYILRTQSLENISEYADITEGLENRIANTNFNTITELIESIKTKRYTYSKLQKAILHILINIKKIDQTKKPKYIRVLGFRKDKKHILSEMVSKAKIPVVIGVKENENLLKKEILSTDIYNIPLGIAKGEEYKNGVVVI